MNAGSADRALSGNSERSTGSSSDVVQPIIVLLGSNIDPRRNIEDAVARLSSWFKVAAVSRIFASQAVGSDGPGFLNAAVGIETMLAPCALQFDALRTIEAQLGRRRGPDPNAPRTIDLDLVVYGLDPIEVDCEIDGATRRLSLPDADIGRLPHMALPIADVAPWLRVAGPQSGTLSEIASALASAAVAPVSSLPAG